MKEIHAYKNDDGTYRIEAICRTCCEGKMVDVHMKAARAKISVDYLVEPSSEELYTVTIKENNK